MSDCNHLDNKHTVFGEIMGGMPTLFKINRVPVGKGDRPEVIIKNLIFLLLYFILILINYIIGRYNYRRYFSTQ